MLDLPVDIKKVLQSDSLPDYQYLFDVLIQVTSVLDKEKRTSFPLFQKGILWYFFKKVAPLCLRGGNVLETVKGYVDHIVFRNEENGYTVALLDFNAAG